MKIFIPVLLALALAGCGSAEKNTGPATGSAPRIAVKVYTANPVSWPAEYERTGTVRARTTAVIASKVMGYVREVRVDTGSHVAAGQTLVVLDSRDLDAQKRAAVAARDEARSALAETSEVIGSAKAQLELAQATHRRINDLYQKTSASTQELDEVTARMRVAQAAYDAAMSRRRQVEAKIAQAEEGVRAAEIAASYSQIQAPFAGVVVDKSVQPGNLANPGATLMTIEREGAYRVEVPIEESKAPTMRAGQTARVNIEGAGREFTGRIAEIVPAVDPATRSVVVKIDVPGGMAVRSGMFAKVAFPAGSATQITVPEGAVSDRNGLYSVFVAEGGRARSRMLTLGSSRDGMRAVLSGLAAGDAVIYPVPSGLRDGAAVEVQ